MELEKQARALQLKIEALKQSISNLNVRYEDQDADRRVEITLLREENDALRAELESERNQRIALETPTEISADAETKSD